MNVSSPIPFRLCDGSNRPSAGSSVLEKMRAIDRAHPQIHGFASGVLAQIRSVTQPVRGLPALQSFHDASIEDLLRDVLGSLGTPVVLYGRAGCDRIAELLCHVEGWAEHQLQISRCGACHSGVIQSAGTLDRRLVVTEAFHAERPPAVYRLSPGSSPVDIVGTELSTDASLMDGFGRRIVSARSLAQAGATVLLCYDALSLSQLPIAQLSSLRWMLNRYPALVDHRRNFPAEAFRKTAGVTLTFGTPRSRQDACLSFRRVERQESSGNATIGMSVDLSTRNQLLFAQRLDELRALDLHLEST